MKVSANLKKIRMKKNISQDALAEMLFVTRQAVSSWETGRTQPDIETLTKIAEIFETDIETLIYGEKRFKKDEDYSKAKRKTITIIFAVLATILVSIGVILIFVTGWEALPVGVKSIFSVFPMLCSQALAVFTYLKKRKNVVWRECTALVWSAGIISTTALLSSVMNTGADFFDCLITDTVLILPIVYILDAVTPLAVYYICSIWYSVALLGETDNYLFIIVFCIAFLLAGAFYAIINRKTAEKPQFIIALWFTLLASFSSFEIISVIICDTIYSDGYFPLPLTAAIAILLFCLEKGKIKTKPFENIAFLALSVVGGFGTVLMSLENTAAIEFSLSLLISIVFSPLIAGAGVLIGLKNIKTDKLRLTFTVIACVYLIFASLSFNTTGIYWVFSVILSTALTVCIMAMGVMRTDFWLLNFGLLGTVVQLVIISVYLIDFDMLTGGILLVLMGAALFTANYLVAKKAKEQKKEVGRNEEQ